MTSNRTKYRYFLVCEYLFFVLRVVDFDLLDRLDPVDRLDRVDIVFIELTLLDFIAFHSLDAMGNISPKAFPGISFDFCLTKSNHFIIHYTNILYSF